MREMVSKIEGGCMFARFDMASRVREPQKGSGLWPSEDVRSLTGCLASRGQFDLFVWSGI